LTPAKKGRTGDKGTALSNRDIAARLDLVEASVQDLRAETGEGPSTDEQLVADGLFKLQEAADFLSIGLTTLYTLVNDGEMRTIKIGNIRRIPKRALVRYASKKLSP